MEYIIQTSEEKPVRRGHLHMGGADPAGERIDINSQYLTYNGRPWLPVMGEFHFSRNPVEYWEEDLQKCKACGIQIISSYVFWIHHEEEEGKFCFTGSRDIRRFVELCKKLGLGFFLRLGPWVHGECRNGGHPDWIYEKCKDVRCNDETYLFYARRLYTELSKQLKGLFFRDGGPIIGIQADNELIREPEHLGTLKRLAQECGMDAPLYTVTGWGHHGGTRFPRDEFIPMFGGYPEGPWEQHISPLAPSGHYLFREERNDADIGVDVLELTDQEGYEGAADFSRYPFATCETGTGIPVTYHRRPVIRPDDVGAMTLTSIGSGNNLVGYFMFKGGTNPKSRSCTYNETKETGYLNNFPTLSNDFQAPVSDFGEIRPVYKVLKRFNLFLGDFGELLAKTQPYFPEGAGDPGDKERLRYCVRDGRDGGFLFINNYIRLEKMPERQDAVFCIQRKKESIQIPLGEPAMGIKVPEDSYFCFPFGMDLGGRRLLYATAQLLCRHTAGNKEYYVFYSPRGMDSEYYFQERLEASFAPERMEMVKTAEGTLLRVRQPGLECSVNMSAADGREICIITLDQEEADNCWKDQESCTKERLVICGDDLFFRENKIHIRTSEPEGNIWTLGKGEEIKDTEGLLYAGERGEFTGYVYRGAEDKRAEIKWTEEPADKKLAENFAYLRTEKTGGWDARQWEISLAMPDLEEGEDIILIIDYQGDVAHLYLGERLIADDYCKGVPWRVGLKRFREELKTHRLTLQILPLAGEQPVYLECFGEDRGEELLCVNGISVVQKKETVLELQMKLEGQAG